MAAKEIDDNSRKPTSKLELITAFYALVGEV